VGGLSIDEVRPGSLGSPSTSSPRPLLKAGVFESRDRGMAVAASVDAAGASSQAAVEAVTAPHKAAEGGKSVFSRFSRHKENTGRLKISHPQLQHTSVVPGAKAEEEDDGPERRNSWSQRWYAGEDADAITPAPLRESDVHPALRGGGGWV
jgi:hypothetical protein